MGKMKEGCLVVKFSSSREEIELKRQEKSRDLKFLHQKGDPTMIWRVEEAELLKRRLARRRCV